MNILQAKKNLSFMQFLQFLVNDFIVNDCRSFDDQPLDFLVNDCIDLLMINRLVLLIYQDLIKKIADYRLHIRWNILPIRLVLCSMFQDYPEEVRQRDAAQAINLFNPTSLQSLSCTALSYLLWALPRAYKRRGHATVHEQKLNGRRNVTGKVQ